MKTFEIDAKESSTRWSYNKGRISLSFDAEPREVAELLTVEDVIAHFDAEELLDAIGIEKVKAHFGLVDEDA